jgi:phospholipase/carboxylesterase
VTASIGRPRAHQTEARLVYLLLAVIVVLGSSVCTRRGPLATIVHGGSGPPTLVLLHGYGSSAEEWEPFTKTIRLPAGGRFVFPQGPDVTVPPDGPIGGRGWWRLDLPSHVPPGGRIPDLSAAQPPGITTAASLVGDLLDRLRTSPDSPILLGGYSQGAMVASQVAFLSDQPLSALILLSGTTVDEASWERQFSRRRGLPVFLSHGRSDATLPFAVADRLRAKLEASGLAVTWHPFDGGHEIPAEVVAELNTFIERYGQTR